MKKYQLPFVLSAALVMLPLGACKAKDAETALSKQCQNLSEGSEHDYMAVSGTVKVLKEPLRDNIHGGPCSSIAKAGEVCITSWLPEFELLKATPHNKAGELVKSYTAFTTRREDSPFQMGESYHFCAYFKPGRGRTGHDFYVIDRPENIKMLSEEN